MIIILSSFLLLLLIIIKVKFVKNNLNKLKNNNNMDPLFMACSLFRRRKYDECIKICTSLLEKNEFDQVK